MNKTKEMTNTSDKDEIERMKEYKGSSFPAPIIPLSGAAIGLVLPWTIRKFCLSPGLSGVDGLMAWIPFATIISGLFFSEFLLGALARSESTRASFSPAAAAASSNMPFNLVRANRIHQNQIESAWTFLPAVLAAAIVDSSWAIACTISWTVARVLYRAGYCYKENPYWRICGVTTAQFQCFICVGISLFGAKN